VLEAVKMHAPANGFENTNVFRGDTFFIEAKQIDLMPAGQLAQQVKGALKRASSDRVGGVRIDDEEAHGRIGSGPGGCGIAGHEQGWVWHAGGRPRRRCFLIE
jgi:hypothetical protein